MAYFSNHLPTTTGLIFLTLLILFGCSCIGSFGSFAQAVEHENSDYELSLSFVPAEGRLIGTAKITIEPGRKLTLFLHGLEVTGTLLRDENGKEHELLSTQDVLILPQNKMSRTLYLSYTKTIQNPNLYSLNDHHSSSMH